MRFAQTHVWPALRNFEAISPSTASSRSASSKMRYGAWPPSSSDSRLIWSAERRISSLPTSVEPVNEILRTRASENSWSATMPAEREVIRLTTPGGVPASSIARRMSAAVSGVALAGLTTLVQPAAIAGPSLRVIIAAGKFQGVIAAVTPTGWRSTSTRLAAFIGGTTCP